MAKTTFKLFSDPQFAREALVALRESGYPAEAIGVLVRKDGGAAEIAGELQTQPVEVGTLPDAGAVAAAGAGVLGLEAGQGGDVAEILAATLGLSPAAVNTFSVSLLRGSVLVAVQATEGLPDAQRILRNAEPATVRMPKETNEAFTLADRRTTTNDSDGQFSGDFRKY